LHLRRSNISLIFLFVSIGIVSGQDLRSRVDHAIDFSAEQLKKTIQQFGDSTFYPRFTKPDGKWKTSRPNEWTSGFFPGCLWMMYSLTDDPFLKSSAERWTKGLKEQQNNKKTHDVGFILFDSFGKGYAIEKNEQYRQVLRGRVRLQHDLMRRQDASGHGTTGSGRFL
jgi:unsaturated chondroitin disaccharide hydrolase